MMVGSASDDATVIGLKEYGDSCRVGTQEKITVSPLRQGEGGPRLRNAFCWVDSTRGVSVADKGGIGIVSVDFICILYFFILIGENTKPFGSRHMPRVSCRSPPRSFPLSSLGRLSSRSLISP